MIDGWRGRRSRVSMLMDDLMLRYRRNMYYKKNYVVHLKLTLGIITSCILNSFPSTREHASLLTHHPSLYLSPSS